MQTRADGRIEIRSGEQRLCVAMLAGPPTVFQQHDGFSVPPLDPQAPPQWHGAFVATQPSTEAEFLVVLSVDCRP
jgi:hypothetical protein